MIGIISDAHGNLKGFLRGIEILKSLGAKSFYFLGDALGYIPNTDLIDELILAKNKMKFVRGNHEDIILSGKTNSRKESVYKHKIIRNALNQKQISFINSWPNHINEVIQGKKILFVHGGPLDFTYQYVFPDSELNDNNLNFDLIFMGHTHLPFLREKDNKIYVNVGSCGLPRDSGEFGSCALLDPSNFRISILRFSIKEFNNEIAENLNKEIHESVIKLFSRKCPKIIGDFIT